MPTKVLLCDTGDWVVQLRHALLRSGLDVEVEAATDTFRALDLAARTQPDVLVTEVNPDGMHGVELIGRLRVVAPRTGVICWSAVSSPDAVAEMYAAGAGAYLLKADGPAWVVQALKPVLAGNLLIAPGLAVQLSARLADSERQQRRMERSAAEAAERLEHVTTAKAEFLANVSHELRTPVTVAKAISHHLKKRSVPEVERKEFLEQLDASLQKLTNLVDDMLTIADLDRGALELECSRVDVAVLLHEVANDLARQYPTVGLERAVPDELWASADPVRIREVVRQVLGNAFRYSPPGEVVHLRARSMAEGIVVSVTDRGQGIQRRVVAQAFNEPFSTGEETLRKERAGAGLGLHLARQLVIQHGGIVWADPLPGGGTRVSFCIPFDREHRVTERPVLPAEPPPPPPTERPVEQGTSTVGSA
jgi:signal transduction histidine kinase